RVVHRHAVHLAALAPGGHAADDLRAVVEALASEVDRLAPGNALDDEGRVLVDQMVHAATPTFSTARRAASGSETDRSPYSTPRATMSTRVLETIDIITAILSTPGLDSTSLVRLQAFETLGLPPISQ